MILAVKLQHTNCLSEERNSLEIQTHERFFRRMRVPKRSRRSQYWIQTRGSRSSRRCKISQKS